MSIPSEPHGSTLPASARVPPDDRWIAAGHSESALVARPIVPMFRGPDPLSEQVSQALLGMTVTPLSGEETPNWQRIRTPDGYEGWIAKAGLVETPPGWHGPWAEVTDLWINLRAGNDYRLAAATQATVGTRLPLVQRETDWLQLLLPDGRRLWVEAHRAAEVVDEPLLPPARESICATAERFLGTPYLWGGCSPLGIDCSGFVQLVLRLHGLRLPRDAHQQAEQGAPAASLRAADLAFFGPEEQPERITHVGLMLDETRFIHAAGSDRVRINRIEDAPYDRQFRRARRFTT